MNIHFNYIRFSFFFYFLFVCFVYASVSVCIPFLVWLHCRIANYFTVDKRQHHFVPVCSLSKVCGRKYEEEKNDTKWMNYFEFLFPRVLYIALCCALHVIWLNQHFNLQTTTWEAVKLVDICLKLLYIQCSGTALLEFRHL